MEAHFASPHLLFTPLKSDHFEKSEGTFEHVSVHQRLYGPVHVKCTVLSGGTLDRQRDGAIIDCSQTIFWSEFSWDKTSLSISKKRKPVVFSCQINMDKHGLIAKFCYATSEFWLFATNRSSDDTFVYVETQLSWNAFRENGWAEIHIQKTLWSRSLNELFAIRGKAWTA